MNKRIWFFLLILILAGCGAAAMKPHTCPTVQAGTVQAVLSPEGFTVIQVAYPCAWGSAPILVASPTGQGSLFVSRFEANSLTGAFGSIAVQGEPNGVISFSFVAVHE